MRNISLLLIAMAFVVIVPAQADTTGPTSELYLTMSWAPVIQVVQGNSIVRSWTMSDVTGPSEEYPIAVLNTVRTSNLDGQQGSEYQLNGAPTGTKYPGYATSPWNSQFFIDGATDGTDTYSLINSVVYRFDLNWGNPELMFSPTLPEGSNRWTGITYDPTNSSLWFASWENNRFANYSLDGAYLSGFAIPAGTYGYSSFLAMDYADGTLWSGGATILYQYSRSGQYLGSIGYADMKGMLGGEFQYNSPTIPEPTSLLLLGTGLGVIGLAAWRRRK